MTQFCNGRFPHITHSLQRFQATLTPLTLLVVTGFSLRVALALLPIQTLVAKILPDDSFYYFVIAHNAAQGLGLSFDGVNPSNGFHPLWALSLIPLYWIASNSMIALRLALVLGALLYTAAAVVLAAAARRIQPRAGIVVAFLYLFNPRLILESINGLETSLALFLLGLVSGLAVAARTDNAIMIALVMIAYLSLVHFPARTGRPVQETIMHLGVSGLSAALPMLAWFGWSQTQLGTIVQSSAMSVPWLIQDTIRAGVPIWDSRQLPMINLMLHLSVIFPGVSWLVPAAGSILPRSRVLSGLLLDKNSPDAAPGQPHPERSGSERSNALSSLLLWAPALGALLILLVHTLIRWYTRSWYFPPLAAAVTLAAGIALARSGMRFKRGVLASSMVGIALLFSLQGARTYREAQITGQTDLLAAAYWIQTGIPRDSILGSFNSGILAYFSDHQVINLDGVVNWDAIHARGRYQLLPYLADRGGTYLVDWRLTIEKDWSPYFGTGLDNLEEVNSFYESGSMFGPVSVYHLKRQ